MALTNATDVVVRWSATNEPLYTLQQTTSLTGTPAWVDVAPGERFGPLAPPWEMRGTNVNALNGASNRFYRVWVAP